MNSLEFKKSEYYQLGVVNKNCLKVLPFLPNQKNQKFVVGDQSGSVSCFEFQKGSISVGFKTQPLSKEISCVELTGKSFKERTNIFFSGGTQIRASTSKGKEYFRFDTNLTDTIRCLGQEDNWLWTAGEYLLNEFEFQQQQGQFIEKSYFMSKDKINQIFIHCIRSSNNFNSILACQDNCVRVLEQGQVMQQYDTKSPANCMSPFQQYVKNNITSKQNLDKTMLFGLNNGQVVFLALDTDSIFPLWNLQASQNCSSSGVSLINTIDFTNNGQNDIYLARDDGSLELYSLNQNGEYELLNKQVLNEAITGLEAGRISSSSINEYIISTYSGKLLGFQDQEQLNNVQQRKIQENPKEADKKVKDIKQEIEKLQQSIKDIKLQESQQMQQQQQSQDPNKLIGAANSFKVNYKIQRNVQDASYTIIIDCQVPMQMITLQSVVGLELMENDSHVAIQSTCSDLDDCDPSEKNQVLVTYRILEKNIQKFEIKLRTIEGKYGNLYCYVIPQQSPKLCQILIIPIKPLSLHEILHDIPNEDQYPLNVLKISGEFSTSEMHTWVSNLLPQVPQNTEDQVAFAYKSSFVESILICQYKDGSAVFKSDSISSLSIVKDVISNQASERSKQININCDINIDSVKRILKLFNDKFQQNYELVQKVQMIPALKEIQIQEGNLKFLSKELQHIAEDTDNIQKLYQQQPKRLQYLRGIVMDLFFDLNNFRGQQPNNAKVQQLAKSLNNFNLETILELFIN